MRRTLAKGEPPGARWLGAEAPRLRLPFPVCWEADAAYLVTAGRAAPGPGTPVESAPNTVMLK